MPALSPNTKRISCRQQALLFLVYSRPLTPRQDEHSHNSFVQLASPALVTLSTTNVLRCEAAGWLPMTVTRLQQNPKPMTVFHWRQSLSAKHSRERAPIRWCICILSYVCHGTLNKTIFGGLFLEFNQLVSCLGKLQNQLGSVPIGLLRLDKPAFRSPIQIVSDHLRSTYDITKLTPKLRSSHSAHHAHPSNL